MMDLSSVIGILSLVVAFYALYRCMTVNSDIHLIAHDVVHDKIVSSLEVCGVQSLFFVDRISDHGYIMSDSGTRTTQQEREAFVVQLKAVDQCITEQLLIDRKNLWRFRIAARVQVASRNRMWRDSQWRVRRIAFVVATQHNLIDTNR
jgi:hypothetical protein